MGIRGYASGETLRFRAICDGCGAYTHTSTISVAAMQKFLRRYRWTRVAYDLKLKHYVWHCRKCKDPQ